MGAAQILPDAVGGQAIVPPFADFFSVGAGKHLGEVIHPNAKAAVLGDAVDAGEKFLGDESAVVGFARLEAVVAGAAVIEGECFTKIIQELRAAATAALGVVDNLAELGASDRLFVRVRNLVEEVRLFRNIAGAEEEQAIAGQAVATRAAGFLIIALNVFG